MGTKTDAVAEELGYCEDKDEKLRKLEYRAETVLLELESRERARARRRSQRRDDMAGRYPNLREGGHGA